MTTVFHCGMPSELSVLRENLPKNALILSGEDKLHLDELVPASCTRLVGIGLCGGTAPGLPVPDVVLASSITDRHGDRFFCDQRWNTVVSIKLAQAGVQRMIAAYYSSGLQHEADDAPERATIYAKYGACAIDDEARYDVALAIKRPGLLVNVCRPISDDWRDNLPLLARGDVMNADGSPNIAHILSSLGMDPSEGLEPGVVAEPVETVVKNYEASLSALGQVARTIASLLEAGSI